ncbi:c-type cytochrome [Desulfonatronum thioautotrophicum]|uniref:c-type cytochrome n=1 Tax=Desulfonatronum thioautotrophicum TaxID=617001 RepID=UPI0005EAF99B|nr:hypothetical protein [Desulfonatronum thioautotrophicum]
MSRFISTVGLSLLGVVLIMATVAVSSEPLDGEQLVQDRCTQCHDLTRVERRFGQDHAWWERTVDRMVGRRAGLLNDEERTAVLDFLANR